MILAIDYGKARIGLALSDTTHTIAKAYKILRNKGDDDAIKKISSIVDEQKISTIVIGSPLGSQSQETQMSEFIEIFKIKLQEATPNTSIIMWNETLTSHEAYDNLLEKGLSHAKIKEQLDMEAARIILQGYLDHMHS